MALNEKLILDKANETSQKSASWNQKEEIT